MKPEQSKAMQQEAWIQSQQISQEKIQRFKSDLLKLNLDKYCQMETEGKLDGQIERLLKENEAAYRDRIAKIPTEYPLPPGTSFLEAYQHQTRMEQQIREEMNEQLLQMLRSHKEISF